jgi:hypothetical protein
MSPETTYLFGSLLAYGASAAGLVCLGVYISIPERFQRQRDWLSGSVATSLIVALLGAVLCVASHLRWQ